jgi:predicted signal transduction protein with EAL and GGDEF domain
MPLTLSVGLTEAVPEDDAVTLIARADKALYQAKSDGRNCRRIVAANAEAPGTAPEGAAIGRILLPGVESSLLH